MPIWDFMRFGWGDAWHDSRTPASFFTQAWLAEEITEYNVLHLSQGALQRQIPKPSSEGSPLLVFAEIPYLSRFLQLCVSALTNSAIFAFLKVCKLTLKGYFNCLPALWKYERQRFFAGPPLTFLKSFHTSLCYSSVQRGTMGSSAVRDLLYSFLTCSPPSDAPTVPGIKWWIHLLVFAQAQRSEPTPTQINDLEIYFFTYGSI